MTAQTYEFAFSVTLLSCARVKAETEAEARKLIQSYVDCIDLSGVKFHPAVSLTEASLLEDVEADDLFEIDGIDLSECDCSDRSWYGPEHDSACVFAGHDRADFVCDAGG